MINIFVVSTGLYNDVFLQEERVKSYNFIFPNKEKRLILISDVDNTDVIEKNLSDDYKDVYYYHICNLTYPFVTLHKVDYVVDCIKYFMIDTDDIFIYSDACNIMIERGDMCWENIGKDLDDYGLCFGENPYKDFIIDEYDPRSKHHLSEYYLRTNHEKYCQLSFFMGRIKYLKIFLNHINQYLLDDLKYTDDKRKKNGILPNFMEQHYANFFIKEVMEKNILINFSIIVKRYITNNDSIDECTISRCHYNSSDASLKRNSKIYRYNL